MAAGRLPPLAADGGAGLAEGHLPADRLPGHQLLLGAAAKGAAEEPGRDRPRDPQDLRQARHPDQGAGAAGRRRRRLCLRQRLGGHHLQEEARGAGHHLLLDLRGDPGASGPRQEVSGLGRAPGRQFLRGAQLGRLLRRQLRLCPQGRALPDGALDLFPHQRGRHGPVRAHADHRRRGLLCELSRGLHGADARREPAPCGCRRADRPRRCRDQVLDGPELVSGRQRGQGRGLQLRHQARRLPRPHAARSAGPRSRRDRPSPGNTRPASCRARTRWASSTRSR